MNDQLKAGNPPRKNNFKNTRQRTAIIGILEQSKAPLSARSIYNRLQENQTPIWLSTVYRTLDILVSSGQVMKSSRLDDNEAIYQLNSDEHQHHAICVTCHKTIDLSGCPLEPLEHELKNKLHFDITGHRLEIYGHCEDCSKGKG